MNAARRNPWLVVGGGLSALAALLHLAIVAGGPDWYRFFGAGEGMARAAARGNPTPHIMAVAIAAALAACAAYGFAGAGLFRRLPLMRTALVLIAAVYLARGLFLFSPASFGRPDLSPAFMFWSSLIVLVYGIVYAVGTWRAWPDLSGRKRANALGS